MIDPKYNFPPGMRIIRRGKSQKLFPNGSGFYRAEDERTGQFEILTYNQVLSITRQSGTSNGNMLIAKNNASARVMDGGMHYRDQLTENGKDQIDFRKALCAGVDALAEKGVRITATNLDNPSNARVVRAVASQLYITRPISFALRGGSTKLVAIMPRGRTLIEYWRRYRESGYDEMSLVDQSWLRGNRRSRVSPQVRELMTRSVEETHLDLKKPNVACALRRLSDLIDEKNSERALSGLEPLIGVSHKTMAEHIRKLNSTLLAVAREGTRVAEGSRTRGATDTRALMIGELVEVDECKLSLITVAKERGWWQRLSEGEQESLAEVEDIIRSRLWLVIILDVASRMPLAWVLTDAPCSEVTLEAIRMATRDKTREKIIYGCERNPMPAVGIAAFKGDNGVGIRNAAVKSGALGITAQTVDVRTYRGGDKPHIERMFGTIESSLLSLLHGYTGRKAGALPGYDAIRNGVLDCEALYGIITRYLVDEYPLERHYGATMFGQRPIKMAAKVNEDYGVISVPSDHDRRIQLGWRSECRITDEGVKAFGLPYTSPELQGLRDRVTNKVSIFSDPDCVNHVTILVEGHQEPILGYLTWTAMQDLTIPEFLRVAEEARAEDPAETQEFESGLARVRRERFDHMCFVANEHKLPRSYMTVAEARAKADVIIKGLHGPSRTRTSETVPPGSVTDEMGGEGVFGIGEGFLPALDGVQKSEGEDFSAPDTTGKLT